MYALRGPCKSILQAFWQVIHSHMTCMFILWTYKAASKNKVSKKPCRIIYNNHLTRACMYVKWLRQALQCPSYSTLVTRSLESDPYTAKNKVVVLTTEWLSLQKQVGCFSHRAVTLHVCRQTGETVVPWGLLLWWILIAQGNPRSYCPVNLTTNNLNTCM